MKHAHNDRINKRKVIKMAGIIIGLLLGGIILLFVALATYFNYRTGQNKNQTLFAANSLPDRLPDGFYKGKNFSGLGKDWKGKTFDIANNTGVNTFSDGNRYAFKTYQSNGLRDNNTVLRLDYNQKGNPLWMRFIVDEIVETKPGNYLGKVHFKIIPGFPVTVAYFELSK